ncbi:hypothetical protein D3C76_1368610 [compost metagenome]
MLLSLESFLASAGVVHGIGEVFGAGDPLTQFATLGGHRHQRLDAGRGNAQGDVGAAGALLDAQDVAGAEACGFARLTGGLQTRGNL